MFGKKTKIQQTPRKPVQDSRFSIRISSEWSDKTSYYIEGPEEDGIKHNIMVRIEENVDAPDIKALAERSIKDLSNSLRAYQEVRQGPVLLNSPLPAYEVLYQWTPEGKRMVYQRMMFVVWKKTAFTLTATFSEKTFKQVGPQVDGIFRSFTVAQP